ncbi:hypothetical protein N182_36455 [Sinorhizobium sp. GL2]|nr:hypothetical protein N182_36455 [Sinorhizobium sp. GL2]
MLSRVGKCLVTLCFVSTLSACQGESPVSLDPKLDQIVKNYRKCVAETAVNNAASRGGDPNAAIARCDGHLAEYRKMLASYGMKASETASAAAKLKESTRKAVGGLLIAASVN